MKKAMNFRLNTKSITLLSSLSEDLHMSKTDILERAIQYYAIKKMRQQSKILEFAGILTDKEADDMLKTIKSSRHNKDEEIDL